MCIAFVGAHRTGKTTLAREVSRATGIPFAETSTTAVMKELGLNPVADMPFIDRLHMQELLLKHHAEWIGTLPRPVILDRSPLDMIAYTIAEIGMHHDLSYDERVMEYCADAAHIVRRHYGMVIAVRPLSEYEADPTKPPPSMSYQTHIQFIIEGSMEMMQEMVLTHVIAERDLSQRVEIARGLIADWFGEMKGRTIIH